MKFEIFDPRDGLVIIRTRFEFIARWLTRRNGLDYARTGEGW